MIQTAKELVTACKNVAHNYKSVYVLGAFGWPMTEANKQRASNAYSFNRRTDRKEAIDNATADTFGFDCVCFVKGLFWGWNGNTADVHGGAVYQSNGVPDIGEKTMLDVCTDVSEDFSKIQEGEYLWVDGHCGIYVGEGVAVECTYRWDDGVQETSVFNITGETGKGRYWKKHGKLPYVTYEAENNQPQDRLLCKGCIGEDVSTLQNNLITLGYSVGADGADGDFGVNTERAVIQFQADNGLQADGIVGPATNGMIEKKLEETNNPIVKAPPVVDQLPTVEDATNTSADACDKSSALTKFVKFILDFVRKIIKLFSDKKKD